MRSQTTAELWGFSSIPCFPSCLYGSVGCSGKSRSLTSHHCPRGCASEHLFSILFHRSIISSPKGSVTVFQGWVCDPGGHRACGIHSSASWSGSCSFFSCVPGHESCLGGVWRGTPKEKYRWKEAENLNVKDHSALRVLRIDSPLSLREKRRFWSPQMSHCGCALSVVSAISLLLLPSGVPQKCFLLQWWMAVGCGCVVIYSSSVHSLGAAEHSKHPWCHSDTARLVTAPLDLFGLCCSGEPQLSLLNLCQGWVRISEILTAHC